jgi:hypothetical protein
VKGRLNLFQRTMLRWRELHPYSAVHVVRIDRPLDTPRLTAVIDDWLEALGLTGLSLDAARARFEYAGGPANTVLAVHPGGDKPMEVVAREIERELNAPFAREGRQDPFRFFVIDAGRVFHLGLAYDHYIAAGDSIVVLLHGIYVRYCGEPAGRLPAGPLERYPATCRRLLLRHPWHVVRGLWALVELVVSCRRSVRPRYPRGTDARNAFVYFHLDPPELAVLVRTAKAWGVTVNDVLLAMLLQVLEPLAGERAPTQRRRELAVASIVNLRRDFGLDPNTTFGQFLSSFRLSHSMPSGIALHDVARDIGTATRRVKSSKLYLQTLLAMAASAVRWRFLSPDERRVFYARNYPAWGGLTMLDVNALWAHAGGRMPPPEYLRAVPTGPLAPMVVAVTTAAGVLHGGITYRTAAFDRPSADRIAAGIIACARRLGP